MTIHLETSKNVKKQRKTDAARETGFLDNNLTKCYNLNK